MVIGERIYYGIYQWSYLRLDLDVLYIRFFDREKSIIGHEIGQNRRQIFLFSVS